MKLSATLHQGSPESNTVLSSARVSQLKQEIEDLDKRLAKTNKINFADVRDSQSVRNSVFNQRTHESYKSQQFNEKLIVEGYEMRASQQMPLPIKDLRSSVHIYQQISSNAGLNDRRQFRPMTAANLSHLTQDVSFDLDKITQSRNLHLKQSLQDNLQEKKQLLLDLEYKLQIIKKEGEAKSLKLTHLMNERDTIINRLQVESIRRQEARDQARQIEVKKREDERAYEIAQQEIRRQIDRQQGVIGQIEGAIERVKGEGKRVKMMVRSEQKQQVRMEEANEIVERQEDKASSLKQKKGDVEKNIGILKTFLKSISEEIQMTQEDLSGKLMQRAEFVAQREELDQMYESGKMAFGKSFELYLKINEISDGNPSGASSARFLSREYEVEKAICFFQSILQQIRNQSKSKFHPSIDSVLQKIENSCLTSLDVDKCLTWIIDVASTVNISLDKKVLFRRLEMSNREKDEVYATRHQQLKDIILEIRRFERLIKENTNIVDNMILPQLKAMSATYTEHKAKYKKLKQACFVLRERIKKADKELEGYIIQRQLCEQETNSKMKQTERELRVLEQQLGKEREAMCRLEENAEYLEKEYRRASQVLLLKEREINHKLDVSVSQSLNATQISILSNMRQQDQEDERLRKRFAEIEDKIREAIHEREEVDRRFNDFLQLLQEARQSCNHAEKVLNSQRSQPNQYKRQQQQQQQQLIEEGGYQVTSFTDNEQQEGDKENVFKQKRAARESIGKLDLSKIQNNNDGSSYSVGGYEAINYKHGAQDSTTLADLSSSVINPLKNSYLEHNSSKQDLNIFNEDFVNMLHHSKYMNEDQSSVMNLSELIVSNNPALKNILQMAASHDQRALSQLQQQQEQNRLLHSQGYMDSAQGLMLGQRKGSVETAEFMRRNQMDQRQQQQQYSDFINNGNSSQPNMLTQSVNAHNMNSLTHSTQRSSLTANPTVHPRNQLSVSKSITQNNNIVRRYLNSGTENMAQLQRSVSPQQNPIILQRNLYQSNNRSSSLENHTRLQLPQRSHNLSAAHQDLSRSHSRGGAPKTRKLNKSLNGVDSLLSMPANPVAISINFGNEYKSVNAHNASYIYNNHSLSGPECIQFSKVDVSFAERIVPLLDGAAFYKKFSSRQSLNENAFDPLNADKFPPENCGYGIRLFQLDKSLLCINVRMNLKIAVEMTIPLNDIVKPIIPQTTMDILRAQKHFQNSQANHHSQHRKSSRNGLHQHQSISNKDLLEEFLIFENKGSISHLAKIGIVNKNSELYRQKCLDSSYYPFSIALTNGRVELIATSYETLKNWIIGINLLVSNKKHIPKLKQLMELKLD